MQVIHPKYTRRICEVQEKRILSTAFSTSYSTAPVPAKELLLWSAS